MNATPSDTHPIKTDGKIATIAASASLSGSIDLVAGTPVKIEMPVAWDAADLTFQASSDDVMFNDFYDAAGTEVVVVASASRTMKIDPADFVGIRFLKVRSGTSDTPVNQSSERQIKIISTVL